jgi:hypothetical protein
MAVCVPPATFSDRRLNMISPASRGRRISAARSNGYRAKDEARARLPAGEAGLGSESRSVRCLADVVRPAAADYRLLGWWQIVTLRDRSLGKGRGISLSAAGEAGENDRMAEGQDTRAAWVQRVLGVGMPAPPGAVAGQAQGASPAATTAPPPAGGGEGAVVRLGKGMLVWNSTRSYVAQQIKVLQDAIIAQSTDEPDFNEIKASLVKLEVLLEVLDDRLIGKMDALRGTTDPAAKAKLAEEARDIVREYQAYVASDPLVNEIDDNGFLPLDIRPKVTASLQAVLATI